MSDIVEFLRARLDEDEVVARAAIDETRRGIHWAWEQLRDEGGQLPALPLGYDVLPHERLPAMSHIARYDPDRVLREVEVKRRIVEDHEQSGQARVGFPRADRQERYCIHDQKASPCDTLRHLASAYADHPNYDPEWT